MILIFRRWDNHQPWWLQYMYSSLDINKWLFGSHTTIYLHNDLIIMCRVVLYIFGDSIHLRSQCVYPLSTQSHLRSLADFLKVCCGVQTLYTQTSSQLTEHSHPLLPPPLPPHSRQGSGGLNCLKAVTTILLPPLGPCRPWLSYPTPAGLPACRREKPVDPCRTGGG